MTTRVDVSVDNAALVGRLSAIPTNSLCRVYDDTGTEPASTAASNNTNVQLAEVVMPDPAFGTPSSRSVDLAGVWADASSDAAGTPAYIRIYNPAGTLCLFQFTVGAEVTITPPLFATGVPFTINSLTLTDNNA